MNKSKRIYSPSLGEMVISDFYMKRKSGGYNHYIWNDYDCVYYHEDTDEKFYFSVPSTAIFL